MMNTRLKKFMETIKSKVTSNTGDTLVEVLVALLIGSLSLTLLAMAISTTMNMTKQSEARLVETYALEDALATATPTSSCQGTVSVTLTDGTEVKLTEEDLDIAYCLPDDGQMTLKPVISYVVDGDE